MKKDDVRISWDYPTPKGGLDKFAGPGATKAELALQLIPALIFGLGFASLALIQDWGWSWGQLVLGALLGIDMLGGVVTNATSAAKRWYHRRGQGKWTHLAFIALHILQPLAIAVFFDPGNWAFVLGGFGFVLFAAFVIVSVPLYLQRPLASLLVVMGMVFSQTVIPVPQHFAWFLPMYFIKLLLSHLLREEPYRPEER